MQAISHALLLFQGDERPRKENGKHLEVELGHQGRTGCHSAVEKKQR